MAQVIVRNLDDEVVSSLKLKAELHGHSLEQELREILKRAASLTTAGEARTRESNRRHAGAAARDGELGADPRAQAVNRTMLANTISV
jgi:plasmid stability protein